MIGQSKAMIGRAEVISFDVFDTLVCRSCGPPEALFLWLGRFLRSRGVVSVEAERFARVREAAESAVWERHGGLDSRVCLGDIHEEVGRRFGLSSAITTLTREAELEVEARCLRVNPVALEFLDTAHAAGRRTIAVSDTYLTGNELCELLRPLGILPREGVFTSSDAGASKKSGRLFKAVSTELGVHADRILHVGDKLGVDVVQARAAGWNAQLLGQGCLSVHEERLAGGRWSSGGLSSALAGAGRTVRLAHGRKDGRNGMIASFGSSVGSVLVIGYVLWVLSRARSHGLARLAFLSRDGQLLANVARTLVRRLDLPIDIVYLKVSRRATNLAATWDLDVETIGWICRHAVGRRIDDVLRRVGLSFDQLPVQPPGIDGEAMITPELRDLLPSLLQQAEIRALVLERAKARRVLVQHYLEAQGILDAEGACGIVDLGGVGSQVRALHLLITQSGTPPPRIFLLGLDAHPAPEVRKVIPEAGWLTHAECWIYDEVRQQGEARYPGLVTLAQICCSADHPTVTGYERSGAEIVPTLDHQGPTAELMSWGLAALQRSVVDVAREMTLESELLDWEADLRPTLREVIGGLWAAPDREEARVLGGFPFETGELDAADRDPLARPYTMKMVLGGLRDGSFPQRSWARWHEASVALSPHHVRIAVSALEHAYRSLPPGQRIAVRETLQGLRGRRDSKGALDERAH